MHDNDEVSKRSKSRMVNKKLPISNKLFINDWLVDTNCNQQSRYFLCGNIIFHNITVHSVHYLMGQFALYAYVLSVFKVFRFQFSAVKNILKKLIILLKQKIIYKIWFKSRAIKFTSFRTAETKWRDQISQTADNKTEVPIYYASRN